jgi:hypothetical protein
MSRSKSHNLFQNVQQHIVNHMEFAKGSTYDNFPYIFNQIRLSSKIIDE